MLRPNLSLKVKLKISLKVHTVEPLGKHQQRHKLRQKLRHKKFYSAEPLGLTIPSKMRLKDDIKTLLGGAITILKHMKVNGKDCPIYEMENKKCWKPPTRTSL
jgi:hypothetical protein